MIQGIHDCLVTVLILLLGDGDTWMWSVSPVLATQMTLHSDITHGWGDIVVYFTLENKVLMKY
jgi:hypothetical protein